MEFVHLTYLTGNPVYYQKVMLWSLLYPVLTPNIHSYSLFKIFCFIYFSCCYQLTQTCSKLFHLPWIWMNAIKMDFFFLKKGFHDRANLYKRFLLKFNVLNNWLSFLIKTPVAGLCFRWCTFGSCLPKWTDPMGSTQTTWILARAAGVNVSIWWFKRRRQKTF